MTRTRAILIIIGATVGGFLSGLLLPSQDVPVLKPFCVQTARGVECGHSVSPPPGSWNPDDYRR